MALASYTRMNIPSKTSMVAIEATVGKPCSLEEMVERIVPEWSVSTIALLTMEDTIACFTIVTEAIVPGT